MANGGELPGDIVESIAISNAKAVGEQPAILANLALAAQIANVNLEQQNDINKQQALFQLEMATVAKLVEIIMSIDPNNPEAGAQIEAYQKLMTNLVNIFKEMSPSKST